MLDSPLSSASCFISTTVTGMPALAKHMAMPPPIVPAPTTAALRISRTGVSSGTPGILVVWRSAKNMWRSAFDSVVLTRCAKRSRSNLRPSSKGRVAAASAQATISNGAGKPFHSLAACSRAWAKKAFGSPSTFACMSRMRRRGLLSLSNLARKSRADSSKSPSAISSTSPSSFALSAAMGLPLVIMRSASAIAMMRGRRCVPPEPGRMPSLTSGSPSCDLGSAMRKWQARASSRPPPSAKPPIAATSGLVIASCWSLTSERSGFSRGLLNSRMSAPPENAFAEPISTAPLTAGSPSPFFRYSMIAARSALPRLFTGGLLSVMTATPSRTAYWATSLIGGFLDSDRCFQTEPREQGAIACRFRISRGQQLLAEEHRVGPGEKAQRLHRVRHALAPRREPHPRLRHGNARRGHRADELQCIQFFSLPKRCACHGDESVDRHAFRVGLEARELRDQPGAVAARLAHADDAAAADAQAGIAHALQRLEPVAVLARGDDLPVELGRGIEVVIVVIEPRLAQPLGLAGLQHAQRGAGLQAEGFHSTHHFQNGV